MEREKYICMAMPNVPILREPQRKTIDRVVFYFDDPLSERVSSGGVQPRRVTGADIADFSLDDYVLFRARFDEIELAQGFYKKISERGIKLEDDCPGMRLEYRRVKTADVPLIKKNSLRAVSSS